MIEADFQRFYGLDLYEVCTRSPRRACGLVRSLPEESALVRHHTGDAVWGWDQELAAVQIEATQGLARIMAAGFGARKSQIPEPLHIPRPHEHHEAKRPKRKATVKEAMSMLGPVLAGPSHG